MSYPDLPAKSLLLPDEVAAFFRVSKKTVYQWFSEGKIDGVRPNGRNIRIFRESAVKLFDEMKSDA